MVTLVSWLGFFGICGICVFFFHLPFRIPCQFWPIVHHNFDRYFERLERSLFACQQKGSKKEIR